MSLMASTVSRSVGRVTEHTPETAREHPRPLDRIDTDAKPHATRELPQSRGARACGPHGVGDEQVVDAALGEDLGLAHGRHSEPDRTVGELTPSELDALVRLRVRAQGDTELPGVVGHRREVCLEQRLVDHEVGGIAHSPIMPPPCGVHALWSCRRRASMRDCSWATVACPTAGPPHCRRSSAWM